MTPYAPTPSLSVFDHFVGLALKRIRNNRYSNSHEALLFFIFITTMVRSIIQPKTLKGTVMQIEKASINDRLRVSKVS